MTEEAGRTRSTLPPTEEEAQSSGPVAAQSEESQRSIPFQKAPFQWRAGAIKRVILIGTIISIGTVGLYVPLYLQTGMWQILLDAAGLCLGLLCLSLARRASQRGQLDATGYWLLLTLVITYGISELVWADETVFNTIGGTLLIFLVGRIVLPGKWKPWVITASLYLVIVLLINLSQPSFRHSAVSESAVVYFFDLGLTILLFFMALWLIGSTFHRGTIRVRLIIAFVTVALVPLIGGSASAILGSQHSDRQKALDMLGLAAELKESEISSWVDTLQTELAMVLNAEETRTQVPVYLQEETPPQLRAAARQKLRDSLRLVIVQRQQFEELLLIDVQGRVILSTDTTHDGENRANLRYFRDGLRGACVQPLAYSVAPEGMAIVLARPVTDERGQVLGILAGRTSLATLDAIIHRQIAQDQTVDIYLVDRSHTLLTGSRFGEKGAYVRTEGVNAAIAGQQNGSGLYDNTEGRAVMAVYHWLPELQVALLAEQDRAEAFRETTRTLFSMGGIAAVTLTIAVISSLVITRSIANPLANLAQAATHIAEGNVDLSVPVERADEIGVLAQAFNTMTGQLRDLIGNLEQHVADRTRELAQRSAYLEVSAEVGRAASAVLDEQQLMPQMAELIRERFDLSFVGFFLLDASGKWAALQASAGEGGRTAVAQGHHIRVGEGLVGRSIANAQSRTPQASGEDDGRSSTSAAQDSGHEAAFPLRSHGRAIGAMTVESDQPQALDEVAVAALQIVADQVAVALDNAHLFAESQASLKASRRAYTEMSREAWAELLRAQSDLGFRSDEHSVVTAGHTWYPEMERATQTGETTYGNDAAGDARHSLAVPIKVRGDVIGVLDTYKPAEAGEWTDEEITLLETIADQLGMALESGRLYQDAQRRAVRERLTREITDQMRRASGVEGIVQTAVDQLFDLLGASRTFVRLGSAPSAEEDGDTGQDE